MSTLSDLFQFADHVFSFIKKRDRTDAMLFEDLIDPLYIQLDAIVPALLDMYLPTANAVSRISAAYDELYNQRVTG